VPIRIGNNRAFSKVYIGSTEAVKVYVGSNLVLDNTASPWLPTEIASLEAWYDADDAATVTVNKSNQITSWVDKSGNSVTAAPESASMLLWDSSRLGGMGAAYNTSSASGSRVRCGTAFACRSIFAVLRYGGGTDSTFDDYDCLVSGPQSYGHTRALMGTQNSASLYNSGSWAGNTCYLNGSTSTTSAVLPMPTSVVRIEGTASVSQNWQIGANQDYTSRAWKGDIGEIMFFSTNLASTDVEKVEGYLAHKWGTESLLPSGHTYKSAPPTV
jgi:hypothetical protein